MVKFMVWALPAAALALFLLYRAGSLRRIYRTEVEAALGRVRGQTVEILREEDIHHLPQPVQRYLRLAGAIGREKVTSFFVAAGGQMKLDPKKGWVRIHSQQYNIMDSQPTRLYFIRTRMAGLPLIGLHTYTTAEARMRIQVAGLFTVLDESGPEMRLGDTTTLFNDMCFFAPATLIDPRIQWSSIDGRNVQATFSCNGISVTARLVFTDDGELVNFISDDRYYMPMDGSRQRARWSTPISNYREKDGQHRGAVGEAVWQLPEGDYCYARYDDIQTVIYNPVNFH